MSALVLYYKIIEAVNTACQEIVLFIFRLVNSAKLFIILITITIICLFIILVC